MERREWVLPKNRYRSPATRRGTLNAQNPRVAAARERGAKLQERTHVYPMSEAAIEKKLEKGQATMFEPTKVCMGNPAIRALPELEQDVWRLHREGVEGKVIGEMVGLRKDQICRMLAGIRDKIQYLYRFWEVIRGDEGDFLQFCGCPITESPEGGSCNSGTPE